MRVLLACALLAPLSLGDSRIDRMIDHLNAGRTREAVEEATPEVIDLLVVMDELSREAVWAMIAHNERYAGKDNYLCGQVLELAREVRKRALAGTRVDERILAAEILVLEGRTARAKKKDDWIAHFRGAAAELAEWHAGQPDRDWALVRAVQILAEGAQLKGAPADLLMEEARLLVLKDRRGETAESPAFLAYRLCLAERLAAAGKKKEAGDALQPFAEIAPTGEREALDRATLYNLAVALSCREGLGLKPLFWTTREKAGRIEFDHPVSRLWSEPRDSWADGAMIGQISPDGRPLRDLYFNWYEPGRPWDQDTPAPKTLQRLGELRFGAIRDFQMAKAAKRTGPRKGSFNRNLPDGLLAIFEGPDQRGRQLLSRNFLFEDKKRAGGWFEVSTWVFGARAPDDPLFDAVVASIR